MTSRGLLGLLALFAAGVTTGCSGAPIVWVDPAEPSPESVLVPVPLVEQREEADCGLACLAALLRHHGLELDEAARAAFPTGVDGVRAGDIRDYLEARGLRARLVHGTLDDARPAGLLRVLDLGLPALVALSSPDGQRSHFVLVTGYDPTQRMVVLMDPVIGTAFVPFDRFDPPWASAGRLMLVVAPGRRADPAAAGS